jgi:hypothetical protein
VRGGVAFALVEGAVGGVTKKNFSPFLKSMLVAEFLYHLLASGRGGKIRREREKDSSCLGLYALFVWAPGGPLLLSLSRFHCYVHGSKKDPG